MKQMNTKTRLDIKTVELGLVESREKARALILAGKLAINGLPAKKTSDMVTDQDEISIIGDPIPFVSRGGLKLQKALAMFPIDLHEKAAADIGASTGGFTDCMLQNGAKRVFAVDVGYGQLAWKLRSDPRVVPLERKNARYVAPDWFDEPLDFASIDVSFISIRHILPPLHACLKDDAYVVALIKPQFEAGRGQVGKHGVVRDQSVHHEVCSMLIQFARDARYDVCGFTYSPITGPKGNIEFLVLLQKKAEKGGLLLPSPQYIVDQITEAHRET